MAEPGNSHHSTGCSQARTPAHSLISPTPPPPPPPPPASHPAALPAAFAPVGGVCGTSTRRRRLQQAQTQARGAAGRHSEGAGDDPLVSPVSGSQR
ncbi:MAG: hypothetical protein E6Q90_12610 [Actinobacteria bacterium]|nr:MAG: hypothetical protein E6Q90_12610 [Actinomycetota bacterium]